MTRALRSSGELLLLLALLVFLPGLFAQSVSGADRITAESFFTPTITAGMSASDRKEVQDLEQRVAAHRSGKSGDMADALQLQLALAQYWSAHNRSTNAEICLQRAQAATRCLQTDASAQPQAASAAPVPAAQAIPGATPQQGFAPDANSSAAAYPAAQPTTYPAASPTVTPDPAQQYAPAAAPAQPQYMAPPSPATPSSPPMAGAPSAPAKPCGKTKASRFFNKLAAALDSTAQNLNPGTAPSTDPCVLALEHPQGVAPQQGYPQAGAYPQPQYPSAAPAGYPADSSQQGYPQASSSPPPQYPSAAPTGYPADSPQQGYPQASSSPPPQYPSAAPTGYPAGSPQQGYPQTNSTPPPQYSSAAPTGYAATSPQPASYPQPAPAAAPGHGQIFSADRAYYAMVGGRLEKWDFYHDGTFLHQGVSAGAGTSVRGSERGTYRIQGSVVLLQIGHTSTAFATPGSASNSTQLGGSADSTPQARQMNIRLIGADGVNGVVLNGTTFKVRHGW